MLKVFNIFDKYLLLIIISLAAGAIGGALQPVRVIGVILMPTLLKNISTTPHCYKGGPISIFTIVVVWGILSLIWTSDMIDGLKELIYYSVHLTILMEIVVFSYKAKAPVTSISYGWIVALFIMMLVALWELQTGRHLPTSKLEEGEMQNYGDEGIQLIVFAAGTFYNYNGLEQFICYCTPFLLYILTQKKNSWAIIALYTGVCLSFYVAITNASRAATATLLLFYAITIYRSLKKGKGNKAFPIIIVLLSVFFAINYSDTIFWNIQRRIVSEGVTSERMEIWLILWQVFCESMFIGVGVGGLQSYGFNSSLPMPHNMFIEIGLIFGIIMLLLLIKSFISMFKKAFCQKDFQIRTFMMCIFSAMPLYTIIESRYLTNACMYAFFASIYVFANYDRLENKTLATNGTQELSSYEY